IHLARVGAVCLVVLDALSGQSEIGTIIASRIIGAVTRKRTIAEGDARLHDLLLASAELAGELLGLSPTELYTAESFDSTIKERFAAMTREVG
ncbi:MAG: hypothetical protein RR209_04310, partial [Angelakisella sp.]